MDESRYSSQLIQLRNNKIIIKSEDDNNKFQHEFTIGDGSLQIIPMLFSTSSSSQTNNVIKNTENLLALDTTVLKGNQNPAQAKTIINVREIFSDKKSDALQNHVIMDNIGNYLDPKDLESGRLTCKLWSMTLKRHQNVILTKSNLQDFLHNQTSFLNDKSNVQYSIYLIHDIPFQQPEIQALFENLGSYMTQLGIYLSTSELDVKQFRSILLSHTPNLEKLILLDFVGASSELFPTKFWTQGHIFNQQFPFQVLLPKLRMLHLRLQNWIENQASEQFITDLLGCAINLRHFEFITGGCSHPTGAIVSALSNKTNLDSLKTLKFDYLSKQELFGLIQLSERKSNRLALSRFELDVSNHSPPGAPGRIVEADDVYIEAFNKLLNCQAQSLKLLRIEVGEVLDHFRANGRSLHIPPMKQLVLLQLEMNYHGLKISFDGSILQNFPSLKRLDYINLWGVEGGDEEEEEEIVWGKHMTNSNPHPNLVTLHFCCHSMKLVRLFTLSELFPNLVRLHLELEGDRLKLIGALWNKWSQLEYLIIDLGVFDEVEEGDEKSVEPELIDEYMTGIRKEDHDTCLALRAESSDDTIQDIMKKFKVMPGISDLTYLCHLELNFNVSIGDVTAYFGFLYPEPKLKTLIVKNAVKVSFECEASIISQLGAQAYVQLGRAPQPFNWNQIN